MAEVAAVTAGSAVEAASTTLGFTDVDLTDTHDVCYAMASMGWPNGTIPAATQTALANALTLSKVDSTGTGAGSVKADFALADALADFLAEGEVLTVTYDVTVKDSQGAISSRPVTFTITGANDGPTVSSSYYGGNGTAEAGGVAHAPASAHLGATGTLPFADVDLSDHHAVTVGAPVVAWSAAGGTVPADTLTAIGQAFSYSLRDSTGTGAGEIDYAIVLGDRDVDFLAEGETLTVTYPLTISDGHGGSVTQPVWITIAGANDRPVLVADASGPHGMTEVGGVTAGSGAESASVTLAFSDVDLTDSHSVAFALTSSGWSNGTLPAATADALLHALTLARSDSTGTGTGSVTASFSLADSLADFLAFGETLTVSYDVIVTDGQNATSTQSVSFTLTGTNDAPVVAADAVASRLMTELGDTTAGSEVDAASATLNFADADLSDTHSVALGAPSASWSAGPLSGLTAVDSAALTSALNSALSVWALNDSTHSGAGSVALAFSAADSAFDFLATGETLTVSYDVTVTDNTGAASTKPVSFTVIGTNDARCWPPTPASTP